MSSQDAGNKIAAAIVADSICNGHRITTQLVTMPRIILSEFNTHRMLSKNSASSRAIPFEKMVKMVDENPFIPIAWQRDHKGMQGTEYLTAPIDVAYAHDLWLEGSKWAIKAAKNLNREANDGRPFITKQLCNRLLEPFMYHTVLVTGTELENFFHLRCPQYVIPSNREFQNQAFRSRKDFIKALENHGEYTSSVEVAKTLSEVDWLKLNKGQAEIHMMALAEAMWDARNESTPKVLQPGEWHIPYMDKLQFSARPEFVEALRPVVETLMSEVMGIKTTIPMEVPLATALCAQTSYTVIGDDGKPAGGDILMDIHCSLLVRPYTNRKGVVFGENDPKHMSPAEHCALAKGDGKFYANFKGWEQYRSMIPNENRR
jgi:hypothetical protein